LHLPARGDLVHPRTVTLTAARTATRRCVLRLGEVPDPSVRGSVLRTEASEEA